MYLIGVKLYWPLFKGKLGTEEALRKKAYWKILNNNIHIKVPMLNNQKDSLTGTISSYVKAYQSVVAASLFPCLEGG